MDKKSIDTIKNLDWAELLQHLQGLATASPTKDQLLQIKPLDQASEALSHFKRIDESRVVLKGGVRPFMQSLDFFDTWYLRLKKQATLSALEIRDVRHFCVEIIALKEVLSSYSSSWLKLQFESLMKADEPLSAIDNIFTSSGDIRSDASETLFNLFREKEQLTKTIQNTLDRLVKDFTMDLHLQDKYVTSREGRWVIPVKGGSQHSVKGIIQSQSQSKQTVFIEPDDVIPLNSRLKQVEWNIEQEIEKLLTELSQYLYRREAEFDCARDVLLDMDFFLAQATLAEHLQATSPRFNQTHVQMNQLRHPLLALQSDSVVPNTLSLDQGKHILLLTGPNAGGKTVLLKSLGLAAQMARCGMPIAAAEGSELPFFKRIITAIGDSQSVDEHLSTFAAHLKVLELATHVIGDDHLLLVDEICGSTDPEEGSALARSFIESYSRQKIFAVITSHLGPLKTGWPPESEVLQGSLQNDEASGRPTYLFIPGVAGQSMALQTAKRVGVHSDLIERAYELLSPEQRAQRQAYDELEKLKKDLVATQKDFNQRTHEAEKLKQKYDKLLKELEREKSQILDRLARDTQKEIQEHISHAKVDDSFKRFQKLEGIKHELPEIIKSKKNDSPLENPISTAQEFIRRHPPGTKVYITSLGQDGIIQGQPNAKGDVPVLSNSLRLSLSWRELKPPERQSNPTVQIFRQRSHTTGVPSLSIIDPTVDCRGLTSEEAIALLEKDLDQAVLRGEDRLKIIHGHGTESLKRSIRAYLSRSPYVKKWKAGTAETGGDGITWAEIDTHA